MVPKAKERPRKYKQKATTIMSIMHVGSSTIDINRLYIIAFLSSCMVKILIMEVDYAVYLGYVFRLLAENFKFLPRNK